MNSRRLRRSTLIGATLLAGFVAAAPADAARRLRATGFYRVQVSTIAYPFQFVVSMVPGTHGSPLGTPNDDAMCTGPVTIPVAGMRSFTIPQNLCGGAYSALAPLAAPTLVQAASSFTMFSGPATSNGAMFAVPVGISTFEHCRATGSCGTGRVRYLPGSGLGGISRMFVAGALSVSRIVSTSPYRAAHVRSVPHTGPGVVGGAFGGMQMHSGVPAYVTQPLTAPTPLGVITAPGPRPTTMSGFTSCPAGGPFPNLPSCVVGTGNTSILSASVTFTHTGFPFTTGTVIVQQTASFADDYFTLQGTDDRTANGVGNVSLVAGGITRRISSTHTNYRGVAHTIGLTLSEKVPSLNAKGLLAAAALVVLTAGYVRRGQY